MDAGSIADVYLRDLAAGTTVLVSRRGPSGPAGNDDSSAPALDADGSHVAFHTSATDLQPTFTDTNLDADVFVRDVAAGQVQLVSRAAAGTATGNDGSAAPGDQRRRQPHRVLERRDRPRRRIDVNGGVRDVFLRDMAAATTTLVSRTAGVNGISGNGAVRAPVDRRGGHAGRVRDAGERPRAGRRQRPRRRPRARHGRRHDRAREPRAAAQANAFSGTPSLSGNGDCVVFETFADNVAANPAGTDFNRVVGARAARRLPVRPAPRDAPGRRAAAVPAGGRARPHRAGALEGPARAAPLPGRRAGQARQAGQAGDRGAAALHALGGRDRDGAGRRAAAGPPASVAAAPSRAPGGRGARAPGRSGAARSPWPARRAPTASRSRADWRESGSRRAATGRRRAHGTQRATARARRSGRSASCGPDRRAPEPMGVRGAERRPSAHVNSSIDWGWVRPGRLSHWHVDPNSWGQRDNRERFAR